MKRGDIWWANLPKPIGRRPVVLLSRNTAYAVRASVTVAPVTRAVHGIPVEVPLGPEDGMPAKCVINLDNILTIPKQNLDRNLTSLADDKLELVEHAMKFALDLH